MTLETRDVRHVLALARIAATDEEIARFGEDLGRVLAYMEVLSGVDVAAVEPMTHGDVESMILREDEPRDFGGDPDPLAEAPEVVDRHVSVPQVVGGEETP